MNLLVSATNFAGLPAAGARTVLTPLAPFAPWTNALLVPTPIYGFTDTNGNYTYSNVFASYSYALEIDPSFPPPFVTNIGIPAGLTGTINAANYQGLWLPGLQIFAYTSTNFFGQFQLHSTNLDGWSLLSTNAVAYLAQLAAASNAALANLQTQSNWVSANFLTPTGNGSGLTGFTSNQIPGLNATNINSGTVAAAQVTNNSFAASLAPSFNAVNLTNILNGSIGTNLIPTNAVYNAQGYYTVPVTIGQQYWYHRGNTNDNTNSVDGILFNSAVQFSATGLLMSTSNTLYFRGVQFPFTKNANSNLYSRLFAINTNHFGGAMEGAFNGVLASDTTGSLTNATIRLTTATSSFTYTNTAGDGQSFWVTLAGDSGPGASPFIAEAITSGNPNYIDTLTIGCVSNLNNNYADISIGLFDTNNWSDNQSGLFDQCLAFGVCSSNGNWVGTTPLNAYGVGFPGAVCLEIVRGRSYTIFTDVPNGGGGVFPFTITPQVVLSTNGQHYLLMDWGTGLTNLFDFDKSNGIFSAYGRISSGPSGTNAGFATYNTNQVTIQATGLTNTGSYDLIAYPTATSVSVTYSDGTNTIQTVTVSTGASFLLHPSWKITAASGLGGKAIPK